MDIQSVMNDVKGRVDTLTTQSQKVVKTSLDSLKQANQIVIEGLQTLVDGHTSAAKDIYASAKTGFDKARTDGVKAVAASPIAYLPPKQKFVSVFNETVTTFNKTGDELAKTLKGGYTSIRAEISGKPAAKKAKATARKTTAARKPAARKPAAKKTTAKAKAAE